MPVFLWQRFFCSPCGTEIIVYVHKLKLEILIVLHILEVIDYKIVGLPKNTCVHPSRSVTPQRLYWCELVFRLFLKLYWNHLFCNHTRMCIRLNWIKILSTNLYHVLKIILPELTFKPSVPETNYNFFNWWNKIVVIPKLIEIWFFRW